MGTITHTAEAILRVVVMLILAPLVTLAFWSHLTAWSVTQGKKGERCGFFW